MPSIAGTFRKVKKSLTKARRSSCEKPGGKEAIPPPLPARGPVRGQYSSSTPLQIDVPQGTPTITRSMSKSWGLVDKKNPFVVALPSSVTRIEAGAFKGCKALVRVAIPWPSVESIGEHAFDGCSSLASFEIPSSVTSIGDNAFLCCSSLASVTIPSSVTRIGDFAFQGCSSLASVTIPSSVTRIRDYAFQGCSSLASVTIPSSVTNIGDAAFSGCSSLASLEISPSVTSIGDYAFYKCSSLASLEISSSVASIGDFAFLASLEISSSVASISLSIGDFAFHGCSSLRDRHFNIPEGTVTVDADSWEHWGVSMLMLMSVTVPSSVTSIGDGAFSGCCLLASLAIPSSVTRIGDGAFSGCSSLASLEIPSSVTSIGSWAFYKCGSLASVAIPSSVTSIGDHAFCSCSSLVKVSIPPSVKTIGHRAFDESCSATTPIIVKTLSGDAYTLKDWGQCSDLKQLLHELAPDEIGRPATFNLIGAPMMVRHVYATATGDLYGPAEICHGDKLRVMVGPKFSEWEVETAGGRKEFVSKQYLDFTDAELDHDAGEQITLATEYGSNHRVQMLHHSRRSYATINTAVGNNFEFTLVYNAA